MATYEVIRKILATRKASMNKMSVPCATIPTITTNESK